MLGAIFKLIFAVLVVQLLSTVVRAFRRTPKRRVSPQRDDSDRVKNPEYKDLTPYDIEDADYEELPKRKE